MTADLERLASSLEGHTFTHQGQKYEVVTATATRKHGTDTRVHIHFTVTGSGQATPIGPALDLDAEHAKDLEYVKGALEETVADIVDGRMPPGTGAPLL